MAQLLVAAAGAGVGFAIGGPTGAKVGWIAGSVLGATVLAPDIEGPRLQDLSVTLSSYGAAIPTVWGGARVGCVPIWAAPLTESISETSGKGGPDVEVASYSASFAVSVADGEIAGIRRIWLDAKLVYDASEDASPETKAASAAFAQFFEFYTGSETQDADPTIEAYEGAGEVEAYRGTAYIVFTDLPLAAYGNRLPQVRVETSTEPLDTVEVEVLAPYAVNPWTLDDNVPVHQGGDTTYDSLIIYDKDADTTTPFGGTYTTFAAAMAAATTALGVPTAYVMTWANSMNVIPNAFDGGAQITDDAEYCYVYVGIVPVRNVIDITVSGSGVFNFATSFWGAGVSPELLSEYDEAYSACIMREMWLGNFDVPTFQGYGILRLVESTAVSGTPSGFFAVTQVTGYWPAEYPTGYFPTIVGSQVVTIRVKREPFLPTQACEVGDPVELGIAQIPNNATLCISSTGAVSPNYTYTLETGTFKQLTQVAYVDGELSTNGLGPVLRSSDPNYSVQAYWEAAAAAAGVTGTYGVDYPVTVSDIGVGTYDTDEVPAGSVVLSTIVGDICEAAGLSAGQINVTALTDTVLGYVRGPSMPARAALEPLRAAYWFDAVENGDKVKFVKRGGASAATLTIDDIGAGLETAQEPMQHERAQESELPSAVSVMYQSRQALYETGTQQARRRATGSQQVQQVELPLVLTDERAADVAEVLTYEPWASRNQRTIHVPLELSKLEPTDVITVVDDASYRLRIIDKTDNGGPIELVCVDDDANVYSPNATAGAVFGGAAAASLAMPTNLQLLDLPILRDADDASAAGYYIAASGYGAGWSGARAFRSTDGGSNYAAAADVGSPAVIGYTETVLPDWGGGNTIDEHSALEVTLHSGTVATITRDQMLAGGNAAAVGDEVIQFQRATLVAGTRWRLTGLLRARGGTEQHTGTHEVRERFVLLDPANVQRQPAPVSDGGVATVWKGVSFGTTLADAFEVDFTNGQAGAKPLAPVHLGVGSLGGGSYAVQWTRRTRLQAPWQDYIDAPLGEASEQYLVEVLDVTDAVVSSQTVTSPAATVTASAGQSVRVRQLSALVGPGFPATAAVN